MAPVDEIVNRILVREGGVADVGDGKGVTCYGQTPSWLEQFNLPSPMTPEDAAINYKVWLTKTGLDLLVTTADSLSDILVDIAVMSDHHKAIKALQAGLGIVVDGMLGPVTLAAVQHAASREILAHLVIAWDMEYQGSIITLNPQRALYAKGWAVRMAGHVRRLA